MKQNVKWMAFGLILLPFFPSSTTTGGERQKEINQRKLVESYSVQAACIVPRSIALMRQTMHFPLLWCSNTDTELLCFPELQTWKLFSSEICGCAFSSGRD